MSYAINLPGIHLDFCNSDFKCPSCGKEHTNEDWCKKLDRSKKGVIYMKCKGCGNKLGISTDYKGDVVVWLKSEEIKLK